MKRPLKDLIPRVELLKLSASESKLFPFTTMQRSEDKSYLSQVSLVKTSGILNFCEEILYEVN